MNRVSFDVIFHTLWYGMVLQASSNAIVCSNGNIIRPDQNRSIWLGIDGIELRIDGIQLRRVSSISDGINVTWLGKDESDGRKWMRSSWMRSSWMEINPNGRKWNGWD
jgi:hypothetical protein